MSSRPRTRRVDFKTLVTKYDGAKPDPYPTYRFQNGRQFKDRADPGRLACKRSC